MKRENCCYKKGMWMKQSGSKSLFSRKFMKRILALLFIIACPLVAMDLTIDQHHISAPAKLGDLKIQRAKGEYSIIKGSKVRKVKRYDVDPVLRKMNNEQLAQVLVGTKIKVSQLGKKDYKLALAGGLNGGGIGGANAGFWAGKFTVHFVAQVGLHVATAGVALVCPPAAAPFYAAAQLTMAPVVETTSNIVAIGCAIAGGAATGPV